MDVVSSMKRLICRVQAEAEMASVCSRSNQGAIEAAVGLSRDRQSRPPSREKETNQHREMHCRSSTPIRNVVSGTRTTVLCCCVPDLDSLQQLLFVSSLSKPGYLQINSI